MSEETKKSVLPVLDKETEAVILGSLPKKIAALEDLDRLGIDELKTCQKELVAGFWPQPPGRQEES